MRAPERIETARLALFRPRLEDAEAIFTRYASDPDVTRFLSWPTHRSVADSGAFVAFSDAEWARWPAGPYLIHLREDGRLLGGTGLAFESASRAMTGYVLAKDAWGHGFATEALGAMVDLARQLGVSLYAMCHPDHRASWRVLEKCGFKRDAACRRQEEFPNLETGRPVEALCYVRSRPGLET